MNNEITTDFKLLKKVKDPNFDIDQLEHYQLSVMIGVRDLQLMVVDTRNARVMLMEDYLLKESTTDEDKLHFVSQLYYDHHLLLAGFWKKIKIIFKGKKFSLIPEPLYDEENKAALLYINAKPSILPHSILNTRHNEQNMINLFSVDQIWLDYFEKTYPSTKLEFSHQSSVLIDGAVRMITGESNAMMLYIDRFSMHVVVVKSGKLQFYNRFEIKKFDEYVKYFRMVAKEMNIDLKHEKVKLFGFLGRNTPHYNQLKKYIHNLHFGNRPSYINMGYVFDEISEHQYFDLLSSFQA